MLSHLCTNGLPFRVSFFISYAKSASHAAGSGVLRAKRCRNRGPQVLVRHVTVTGAHHKEFFSLEQAPFDIPSNSYVRRWNPGMADIRPVVQAMQSNKSFSIGRNALNKLHLQKFSGKSNALPLFLISKRFLEGAPNHPLNDMTRCAEPAT
jgi:hypothetical protein